VVGDGAGLDRGGIDQHAALGTRCGSLSALAVSSGTATSTTAFTTAPACREECEGQGSEQDCGTPRIAWVRGPHVNSGDWQASKRPVLVCGSVVATDPGGGPSQHLKC
jgi:hypothetical protein